MKLNDKLKEAWEEHPVELIGAAALSLASVAALIDAVSAARGRRAYSKQVNYRIKHRQ